MGREIRRVPPNWEHPKYTKENARWSKHIGSFIPMVDEDYESAAKRWVEDFEAFNRGEHEACEHVSYFWEWRSPPDEEICRPAFDAEPAWYQMYETVTEGTPCTPPFATKEELVRWLVEKGENHGTEWERRFTKEQAAAFVEAAWAPSFVMTHDRGLETGVEACEVKDQPNE